MYIYITLLIQYPAGGVYEPWMYTVTHAFLAVIHKLIHIQTHTRTTLQKFSPSWSISSPSYPYFTHIIVIIQFITLGYVIVHISSSSSFFPCFWELMSWGKSQLRGILPSIVFLVSFFLPLLMRKNDEIELSIVSPPRRLDRVFYLIVLDWLENNNNNKTTLHFWRWECFPDLTERTFIHCIQLYNIFYTKSN